MLSVLVYELDLRAMKSGVLINRWAESVVATASATSVTATSGPCPADRVRVLRQWSVQVASGAAQTSTMINVNLIGAGSQVRFLEYRTYAAAQNAYLNGTEIEWMLIGGETVNVIGTYNAGAVANAITLNLIGYEFPRGNISG